MNKSRTISINPQFLNISKKKVKPIPIHELNINSSNIRQLLLEKLRHHKKTKKNPRHPMIQLNTMDENNLCRINIPDGVQSHNALAKIVHVNAMQTLPIAPVCIIEPILNHNSDPSPVPSPVPSLVSDPALIKETFDTIGIDDSNFESCHNIKPDKPYGILKNGIKPTYKTWSREEVNDNKNVKAEVNVDIDVPMIEEKEIKKTFVLGKNKQNKTISVLIKNSNTRKKVESDKINYKKTSLITLKNHLKKNNLIKFGTTAPSELLREMYENTKLCGEIINENSKNIVHNFKEH